MADRRSDSENGSRSKRQKTDGDMDAADRANPYLAHMYENDGNRNGSAGDSPLASFTRHKTTAEQARKAEDSTNNPFNGAPASQKYFSILKTRRDLPVHAQRYATPPSLATLPKTIANLD